jgi:endoglucanase
MLKAIFTSLFLLLLTPLLRAQSGTQRLNVVSVSASENTGQNYSSWLSDDLGNLVPNAWSGNDKWVEVTLRLAQKSRITDLYLYDYEGSFADKPALLYALNGTQRTLIGSFDGSGYMTWVSLKPTAPLLADAILVRKFGNNIPQKIKVFGTVIPAADAPAPPVLLTLVSATDSPATGSDYSALLNNNPAHLVPACWLPTNARWTDVTVLFDAKSMLTKLELYDAEGSFEWEPALIYALHGTEKTLLGTFTGDLYQAFRPYSPATPLPADGIVIHKYGNNMPVKIRAYGYRMQPAPAAPTPTEPTPAPTPTPTKPVVPTPAPAPVVLGAKIPIDADRWYQLNNSSGSLAPLFDGHTNAEVQTGWGKILPAYEAYYPLRPGEAMTIQAVRFYDGNGTSPTGPLRLSIITDDWRRVEVAQFQGLEYNTWVGPNPTHQPPGDARFLLEKPVSGARYLLISTSDFWPREIELYGTYQAPGVAAAGRPTPKTSVPFRNMLGINGFEWDFFQPGESVVSEQKARAMRSFGVLRHYMDWEKLELTEGNYTFNPTHAGGWNYDAMYARCRAEGIEVMACLKELPPWMLATYPADQQNHDNVPLRYGRDFSSPASYAEQAKAAFQFAARYGKNSALNPALVRVNPAPRWTNDPPNTVKIGLGLVNFIECDNERDKWWKGRKAYQTGREYAANMSAFYDGHKNTMGPGVGVKNADPTMTVVMGGLCSTTNGTDYIRGMIDWCREFRGHTPNGSVNLCWDVINYHLYPDNANSTQSGFSTRGAAPELSTASVVARSVLQLAREACHNMPVYLSETGYDLHPGSPLKAVAIGPKSALMTQADWNLRTALLYAREGMDRVDFYQTYDQNPDCATQFCSMGFLNPNLTRKPTADYFYQAKTLLGNYTFRESLSSNPHVDRYEHNGRSIYALWVPDEVGRTTPYTLSINESATVNIYTPQVGADTMSRQTRPVVNGRLALTLTETPIFVTGAATAAARIGVSVVEVVSDMDLNAWQPVISVFPNPASAGVTIGWTDAYAGPVSVTLRDSALGLVRNLLTINKKSGLFSTTVDLSALPMGIHLLEIEQGNRRTVRRILKVQE